MYCRKEEDDEEGEEEEEDAGESDESEDDIFLLNLLLPLLRCYSSNNKHSIAKTEEAELLGNRLFIEVEEFLATNQTRDQHEET